MNDARAYVRRTLPHREAGVSEVDVVAAIYLRARDFSGLVGAFVKVEITSPVRAHNIRDVHQAACLERLVAIVLAVLVDLRPNLSTLDMEVRE